MKILCLYGNDCAIELFDWIKEQGHETVLVSGELNEEWCRVNKFDLTVSYTYRNILSKEHIEALNNNVVNLHNSILPFNRGADPNLWSILDGTPRGSTLHYINEDVDKGDIIMQKLLVGENEKVETLKSSYDNLDRIAKDLFKEAFSCYEDWTQLRKKTRGKGSYHSKKDGERIKAFIRTFDIRISEFKNRMMG